MKKGLLIACALMLLVTAGVFAQGRAYASASLASGLYLGMYSQEVFGETYETLYAGYGSLGVNVQAGYILDFGLGFGISGTTVLTREMTYTTTGPGGYSADGSTTSDEWDNLLGFGNLSVLIFFTSNMDNKVFFKGGLGPSFGYYQGEDSSGDVLTSKTIGVAGLAELGINLTDMIYVSIAMELSIDFALYDDDNEQVDDYTFGLQYYPMVGIGFLF